MLTVKQLIKKLEELPEEAVICVYHYGMVMSVDAPDAFNKEVCIRTDSED